MAIEAVTEHITPDYLRKQAAQCREESEAARQRAIKLGAEAIRLEREADALEAVGPLPLEGDSPPSERALLAGEVAEHLNHHRTKQGKSSSELAALFGVPQERMRSALALAVECGFVKRTGLNRGTRYWAADKAPETPDPFGKRWHERVRDVAIELETFTLAELTEQMPGITAATARRWMTELVESGRFEVERVGKTNVYAYVPPEAPEPVRGDGENGESGAKSFGAPRAVKGTGNRKGHNRRDVRDLLKTAERQGATIKPQKHGFAIERDGEVTTSVPRTASDHRSLKNATAALRRNGIETTKRV